MVFKLRRRTQFYDQNQYLQCSKDHNSKRRQTTSMVLVFCTWSDGGKCSVMFFENISNVDKLRGGTIL